MSTHKPAPVEVHLLAQLAGKPWQEEDFTPALHRRGLDRLRTVSQTLGFNGSVSWMTTGKDNDKFAKSVAETIGVTILAARSSADAWANLAEQRRQAVATALGTSVEDIDSILRLTVCPRSTACCRAGCVVNQSAKAKL
jgi:hypothetical protein